MIRWVDASLDRPRGTLDAAVSFWSTVTGSDPQPQHEPGLVHLHTAAGDDWLAIRELRDDGPAGHHFGLGVDDLPDFTGRALTAGAGIVEDHGDRQTLRSPGGLVFRTYARRAAGVRPRPFVGPGGVAVRPHQICVDLGPSVFEDEVRFWATLTGWRLEGGEPGEFRRLQPEPPIPIRFLLQRLDEERPTSAHLDVSCSDIPAGRAWHESVGATFLGEWPYWTTLRDPAGGVYCLTKGDPATD